jgi:hypothetical protein
MSSPWESLAALQQPVSRRHKLFISHAWDYADDYNRLVALLNASLLFLWDNLSVPQESPLGMLAKLPKSHRNIVRQLDERILKSDCVLVLAGMYVAHRGWIQSEIEAAKEFHKPIIAVEPRGNERFPDAVMHAADARVGWNSNSIVSAVRRCTGTDYPALAAFIGLYKGPAAR